jgi:hypothetical protein
MLSIRRPVWAALAAAALTAGCSSEEAAPPVENPTVTPAPAPSPTPAPGEMKSDETTSAPAPAVEPTPAPAEEKKDEGKAAEPEKKDESAPPKVEAPKADAPKADEPKAAAVKLSDEEIAEIKKLPAGEQDAALKQAVCPVSGENLGSMGTPLKVTAEGKTFYLCCKGCKKDVDADAKKVLEKLSGK